MIVSLIIQLPTACKLTTGNSIGLKIGQSWPKSYRVPGIGLSEIVAFF